MGHKNGKFNIQVLFAFAQFDNMLGKKEIVLFKNQLEISDLCVKKGGRIRQFTGFLVPFAIFGFYPNPHQTSVISVK